VVYQTGPLLNDLKIIFSQRKPHKGHYLTEHFKRHLLDYIAHCYSMSPNHQSSKKIAQTSFAEPVFSTKPSELRNFAYVYKNCLFFDSSAFSWQFCDVLLWSKVVCGVVRFSGIPILLSIFCNVMSGQIAELIL